MRELKDYKNYIKLMLDENAKDLVGNYKEEYFYDAVTLILNYSKFYVNWVIEDSILMDCMSNNCKKAIIKYLNLAKPLHLYFNKIDKNNNFILFLKAINCNKSYLKIFKLAKGFGSYKYKHMDFITWDDKGFLIHHDPYKWDGIFCANDEYRVQYLNNLLIEKSGIHYDY